MDLSLTGAGGGRSALAGYAYYDGAGCLAVEHPRLLCKTPAQEASVTTTVPPGPPFTTRPELAGTFGMVASTHWLASAAGMAVLEQGGNAFDAAAAAGFVLQVVEPHLNGPGGEVPVIGYDPRRGETFVVCGQGTAHAGATVDAYRELG